MTRFFALRLVVLLLLTACSGIRIHPPIGSGRPPASSIRTPTLFLDVGDGGVLSNEPCGPPCFWGIEPGKTTFHLAHRILEERLALDLCEERIYVDELEQREEGVLSCAGILDIRYLPGTDEIYYIRFEPVLPILLQDVVAKYGPPDLVVILNTGLPEYPSGRASLYYSKLRMVLPMTEEQEGFEYRVAPSMPIDTIGYLSENEFQRELEIFADNLHPWRGYGKYPLYERRE